MVNVFYGVVNDETVDQYKSIIEDLYKYRCELGWPPGKFSTRIFRITDHKICADVKAFLEERLDVSLTLQGAELQVWPVGGNSVPHVHNARGREGTDYNSLLYLNDDFTGGEFFTEQISLKPIKNMLTFFDGSSILHGVTKVEGPSHRYTIIFWWQNTKFNGK